MKVRVDVEKHLSKYSQSIKELSLGLRDLVLETDPELDEVVKWGYLVYEKGTIICSINPHKYLVNLQIWGGVELDDPKGLLEGTGKKMRHVKFENKKDLKKPGVKSLLKQAINKFSS
jgi:hypothetical protein